MRLNAKTNGPSFDLSKMPFDAFASAIAEMRENERIRARNRDLLATCEKKPKPQPKFIERKTYSLDEAVELSKPLTYTPIGNMVTFEETIIFYELLKNYTFERFIELYRWLLVHPHPDGYYSRGETTTHLLFLGKYTDGSITVDNNMIFATHVELDASTNEPLTYYKCKQTVIQFKTRITQSYIRFANIMHNMPTLQEFVESTIKSFESDKQIKFSTTKVVVNTIEF